VSTADHFLYFRIPCLSLRDVRIALQFVARYGDRAKGDGHDFLTLLKTNRRTFDDYPAIEKALRDYYGFQKEAKKDGEKETPQEQVKKAIFRESALKGLDFEERKKIIKIEKLFKGRYIKNE